MNVTFSEIPEEETVPPQSPDLTRAQQEAAASALRLPPNRAHEITRHPTITLPGFPICIDYVTYFSFVLEKRLRDNPSSPHIAIMCENTETWMGEYGNAAAVEVLRSMLVRGRPPVRWAWTWHVEPRSHRNRRHSPTIVPLSSRTT